MCLLKEMLSYEEVGRHFGVSGNAVKKAARRLNISLPVRRRINPKETFNKRAETPQNTRKAPHTSSVPLFKDLALKNKKQLGEIGERIAIGELSKFGIDILLPMSDNLPYDFVAIVNNKFYKCQVKTSAKLVNGAIAFSLTSNNWQNKEIHKYTKEEVDIFICCDLQSIYLFKFEELEGKSIVTLRYTEALNKNIKGVHFAADYKISEQRLSDVFQ